MTDRELMQQYRERMVFLEKERHEWINLTQKLRSENARMRKLLDELASLARKYPPEV